MKDKDEHLDGVEQLMRLCKVPLTRRNYIDLAYFGDPPEPWGPELELELPARYRRDVH